LILFLPLITIWLEFRSQARQLTLTQAMNAKNSVGFGGKTIEAKPRLVE
jgi:hypothetical protein